LIVYCLRGEIDDRYGFSSAVSPFFRDGIAAGLWPAASSADRREEMRVLTE